MKRNFAVLWCLGWLASFGPALAEDVPKAVLQELSDVRRAIQEQGAGWQADISWISLLSSEQQAALFGNGQESLTKEDGGLPVFQAQPDATLPRAFDWRDNNGNFVTPPKNQGNCGACWAFASTAVTESMLAIAGRNPGTKLDLSEQILVSCSFSGSCLGGGLSSAFGALQKAGTQMESCLPYRGWGGCSPCGSYKTSPIKIKSFFKVARNRDAIKQALLKGPLDAGMTVYSDFRMYKSGVYKRTSIFPSGGHAVTIVGYNDDDQCWIVKNSWGQDWGEDSYGKGGTKGYFRIAYGPNGVEDTVYGATVEVQCSCPDQDKDGFYAVGCQDPLCKGDDCDDQDAAVHPGAAETANGKDDNCDGQIDEGLTSALPPGVVPGQTEPEDETRVGAANPANPNPGDAGPGAPGETISGPTGPFAGSCETGRTSFSLLLLWGGLMAARRMWKRYRV